MSPSVIGIGEILWDLLPAGPQLGGAPANFAYHAHALGARASVITRIGRDPGGMAILQRFKEIGLATDLVQVDPDAPTGTVTVVLDGEGVPQFTIHENVAWDLLELSSPAEMEVRRADAICFGSLGQRNPSARSSIQTLLAQAPVSAWRVFDINLRQQFFSREIIEQSLQFSNVLKLNEAELPLLAAMFGLQGTPQQQIGSLAKSFRLKIVVLTRGALGSLLWHNERWSEQGPRAVEVVDTVGAGDAFTAALVMGLLSGLDLIQVHAAAAQVAGYVCSQPGATPPIPESLRQKFVDSSGGIDRDPKSP
jgi:fructokinase